MPFVEEMSGLVEARDRLRLVVKDFEEGQKLRQQEGPRELIEAATSLRAGAQLKDAGEGGAPLLRTYGIGAQILSDLGVRRMRVLSAPMVVHGLSGFGLEVVEYVYDAK